MVEVQQCALGAFEKNVLALVNRFMQKLCGVTDKGYKFFGIYPAFLIDFFSRKWFGVIEGTENLVLVIDSIFELLFECVKVCKVCGPYCKGPAHFVGVAGSDASYGGADFVFAQGVFTKLVFRLVVVENKVCVLAYEKTAC